MLIAAELTTERESDLALSWSGALERCGDSHLEQWFFDRIDERIDAGQTAAEMTAFWTALSRTGSPTVKDFLRAIMLDESLQEELRSVAGGTLFQGFEPEDRRREFNTIFLTQKMPPQIAWGQTEKLLKDDAERTLLEITSLVQRDPSLSEQAAFDQLVVTSDRFASAAARTTMADALEALLRRSTLTNDQHRGRLRGFVEVLRRPRR